MKPKKLFLTIPLIFSFILHQLNHSKPISFLSITFPNTLDFLCIPQVTFPPVLIFKGRVERCTENLKLFWHLFNKWHWQYDSWILPSVLLHINSENFSIYSCNVQLMTKHPLLKSKQWHNMASLIVSHRFESCFH